MRASEYYKNDFKIFDGVDPSDIIMGSCNNCYMLAALAGIAEAHEDEVNLDDDQKGQRIRDNFLTQEVNSAGCYAIQFILDGQPRTIVVDDFFPFIKTKAGKEVFAFSKCKDGENEIWVQLIEKAWAKLCGSYESSEMGRTGEFFQNFDGTPTEIHWTDDYETSETGLEQLLRIMQIADRNSWIMCGSLIKKMKKATKDAPKGVLKNIGLKNCHSYTIIDVREVVLDNGELEYLVYLRNPTGNFYLKDDEVWKGDWGPTSKKWTDKVRKQVNYWLTEDEIARAKYKAQKEMLGWKNGTPKKKKKKKKRQVEEETDDEIEEDEDENLEDEDAEGGERQEIWTVYEGGENKDGQPPVENVDEEEEEKK